MQLKLTVSDNMSIVVLTQLVLKLRPNVVIPAATLQLAADWQRPRVQNGAAAGQSQA